MKLKHKIELAKKLNDAVIKYSHEILDKMQSLVGKKVISQNDSSQKLNCLYKIINDDLDVPSGYTVGIKTSTSTVFLTVSVRMNIDGHAVYENRSIFLGHIDNCILTKLADKPEKQDVPSFEQIKELVLEKKRLSSELNAIHSKLGFFVDIRECDLYD